MLVLEHYSCNSNIKYKIFKFIIHDQNYSEHKREYNKSFFHLMHNYFFKIFCREYIILAINNTYSYI